MSWAGAVVPFYDHDTTDLKQVIKSHRYKAWYSTTDALRSNLVRTEQKICFTSKQYSWMVGVIWSTCVFFLSFLSWVV